VSIHLKNYIFSYIVQTEYSRGNNYLRKTLYSITDG